MRAKNGRRKKEVVMAYYQIRGVCLTITLRSIKTTRMRSPPHKVRGGAKVVVRTGSLFFYQARRRGYAKQGNCVTEVPSSQANEGPVFYIKLIFILVSRGVHI